MFKQGYKGGHVGTAGEVFGECSMDIDLEKMLVELMT